MRLFEFAEGNSADAIGLLMNVAERRMQRLADQFYFLPGQELTIPNLDLAMPFVPEEEHAIRLSQADGQEVFQLFGEDGILLEVPLETILTQRKSNLVSETKVKLDAQGQYHIPYVVAECGYGTSAEQIMLQALNKGIVKCWGARSSCGVTDIFMRYGFEEIEVSTITFEVGEVDKRGERIEVLLVGDSTTNVPFVNYACGNLASAIGMRVMSINDL